jgi:hypothetical protein
MVIKKYIEPEQLVLDFFIQEEDDGQKYSHTIELYDAIPKYFWGKQPRDANGYLPTLNREFKHRDVSYTVEVLPARITKKIKGKQVEQEYYPGAKEEIIEDALRKIATESRAERVDNQYGLRFSLRELKKELDRTGHSFNNNQIKEALKICARSKIEIKSKKNGSKVAVNQSIFPFYAEATREDWLESKAQFCVAFHSLVTKSIEQKSYRQVNYEKSMKISNALARWLHKRMSHNYRQAQTFANDYGIKLTTILRDSGMTPRARLSDSRKAVKMALEELKQQDVLFLWEELESKNGRKLSDVKFVLRPTIIFSQEMKRANAKTKLIG